MRVIPFDSKLPVKFRGPRAQGKVPEGMQLLAGVALIFWGPPLLYSAIIGHPLPFFVMACNEALGVLLGILLYRKHSVEQLSCVPAGYVPEVPRAARAYKKRDAA